ncbi:DNA methyltransferase [Candidatus Desantisbacteria bacterium CG1_02_49_89]|nr:MAG: DNA methyltransferase [Candidatus Desantisbacteria bacterium CG1_02_49_89]
MPVKNKYNNTENVIQIQNRRYLGNKYKLLALIEEIIEKRCKPYNSFCDIFAGTGVTGEHFNAKNIKIISNEILYSNYVSLYAWLSPEYFDREKIEKYIDLLNSLSTNNDNYFSVNYGGTYFTVENARKIGAIREKIEELKLNFKEKCILLTSLLYAVDKVANTCGHYDAFRKTLDMVVPLKLRTLDIKQSENRNNEIYNKDSNVLINDIEPDILYIDPPYNSRQYCDSYHLLENLIVWDKQDLVGKAKKMDRSNLKSKYCLKDASKSFSELIHKAKCKHILVSYNNTGESKDNRSNARIKDNEIINILKDKGEVEIFEQHYKAFTTGKSITNGHTERVFYCKVRK